jgi:GTPase SAR1 family protein
VENTLTAENKQYIFSLMDLNVTTSVSDEYRVIMDSLIAGTDAIILLYDITSRDSFDRVTNDMYVHIWHARNTVFRKQGDTGKMEGLKKRFGCVVVGNKLDLVVGEGVDQTKRQTKKGEAGDWAESQGFKAFEVSSNDRGQVEEAVKALVASWRKAKWMDDQDDKDSRDAGKGSETKSSVGALLKKAIGGLK